MRLGGRRCLALSRVGSPPVATDPVESFLGPGGMAVLRGIADEDVRDKVTTAIGICARALVTIDALNLSPHEVVTGPELDLSVWGALAPQVRNVLVEAKQTAEELMSLFPAEPEEETRSLDLDMAFSEIEDPEAPVHRGRRDLQVDEIAAVDRPDVMAHGVHALAAMLQSDFATFGGRLRDPKVVADRWRLLSELHELKSKCTQCLEAVVVTLLRGFTGQMMEALLPRYASAAMRSVRLRTRVVDMSYQLMDWQEELDEQSVTQLDAMRQRLGRLLALFAKDACYQDLRPVDKREFLLFQEKLRNWEAVPEQRLALVRVVSDFSAYLDVMRAINRREVLQVHDRSHLLDALDDLTMGGAVERVVEQLWFVYGRSAALDTVLRAARHDDYPDEQVLKPMIEQVLSELGGF